MADNKVIIKNNTEVVDDISKVGGGADLTPEQVAELEAKEAANNKDKTGDNVTKVKIDDKEYNINESGDALNDDGTVFKTKDELSKDFKEDNAGESVDIDGVIYTIDKDGNYINENGVVTYTAEQVKDFNEVIDNTLDPNVIAEKSGLVILDKEGNKVKYDANEEGVIKYTTDVYESGKNDGVNEYADYIANTFPIIPQIIQHLQDGGRIDDFQQKVDYAKVKLDKTNAVQLKNIIKEARLMRGDRPEAIERYISVLEQGNTDNEGLLEEAILEQKYIVGEQTKKNEERRIKEEERINNEIETSNNYWGVQVDDSGNLIDLNKENSVYHIIKTGILKVGNDTYTIPEKIKVIENGKPTIKNRKQFFDYLYAPIQVVIDNKRVTTTLDNLKVMKVKQNRTVADDVFEGFERFVDYDKSQFIKEQINNNKAKEIKKLTTKGKSPAGGVINNPSKINTNRVVIK